MTISDGPGAAHRSPPAGTAEGQTRPAQPASDGNRRGAGRTAGLMMSLAAVTLGVASYLHRDGHIALGFTVINGERSYGASVPEAVIAIVLAVGAIAALVAPHWGRPAAIGTTTFAVLGVAYGLSVTVGSGRAIDIAYHSALLAVLLATEIILWRRATHREGSLRKMTRAGRPQE